MRLICKIKDNFSLFHSGEGNFSLLQNIQTRPIAHIASYSLPMEVPYLRVMWLDCEVNHSRPSIAEVSIEWRNTSTLCACLHNTETQLCLVFIFSDTWQYLLL